jgi:predicted transcriptional regulator of viral defense system
VVNYLWEKGKLREYKFKFPARSETRYILGEISAFEIAQSLKPNSYLAHEAAMYLNGLTENYPKTIYLNVEQAKYHTRNRGDLNQAGIDRAFKSRVRVSNEVAECNGIKVCVTHGQKCDRLGVVTIKGPRNENLSVTDAERTLVDITVRPIYAGGTKNVLKAYEKAKNLISVKRLVKILEQMDYVYPFHQAIGFYLERSGVYSKEEIQLLKEIPMNYDFYLDYKMNEPKYSKNWRLYYPKNL